MKLGFGCTAVVTILAPALAGALFAAITALCRHWPTTTIQALASVLTFLAFQCGWWGLIEGKWGYTCLAAALLVAVIAMYGFA